MSLEPIARRVARRYRRDVLGGTRVEYTDKGNIDATTIIRLLKPTLGPILRLTFWHPITGMPNTVAWDAVTPDDRIVRGRVVLHAAVVRNVVTSWAEVFVDSVGKTPARRT